jgi:hypothetical protein
MLYIVYFSVFVLAKQVGCCPYSTGSDVWVLPESEYVNGVLCSHGGSRKDLFPGPATVWRWARGCCNACCAGEKRYFEESAESKESTGFEKSWYAECPCVKEVQVADDAIQAQMKARVLPT